MCVNINKACNVLCSQSLCDVVVSSCSREVQSKSSFVLRVSSCHFGICCCFGIGCCHYCIKNSYTRKKDKTVFCDLLFCIVLYL